MSMVVNLRWDNASHPLLKKGTIGLLVNGAPVQARKATPGAKQFFLSDAQVASAGVLAIHGGFRLEADDVILDKRVNPPQKAPAMSEHILEVHQEYRLIKNNTELEPVPRAPFTGPHPLVTTSHTSSTKTPVAEIRVDTNFVDITPFWFAYAAWSERFTQDRPSAVSFQAMAYTGDIGRDWIWFAGVPTAAATATDPSCLVYYMYEGYAYAKVAQAHDMFQVNRHLLSPDPSSTRITGRDVFSPNWNGNGEDWWYLRSGFLQALEDSGRKVVLLYPLPHAPKEPKKTAYGPGQGKGLVEMVAHAFRFLHAQQLIGKGAARVARRRLALAGYSAGGLGMWGAMMNNYVHVDELYSLDTVGTPGKKGFVQQWIRERLKQTTTPTPDPRLRLTGSVQMDGNAVIYDAVSQSLGAKCSISPPRGQEQAFWTDSGNPLWNHMLAPFSSRKDRDAARANPTPRHQFALQGGSGGAGAGGYLLEFLRGSDL